MVSRDNPSPSELESIVREVLLRLGVTGGLPDSSSCGCPAASAPGAASIADDAGVEGPGLFSELETAVAAARKSFLELGELSFEKRKELIAAMRAAARAESPAISRRRSSGAPTTSCKKTCW